MEPEELLREPRADERYRSSYGAASGASAGVEAVVVMMMSARAVASLARMTFVFNVDSRNAIVSVRPPSAPL